MEAWENFLRALEQRLGAPPIRKWVKPLTVARYDACNLYLKAENSFQIAWFEEHVRPIAQKQLLNNNGHLIKVHFEGLSKKRKKSSEVQTEVGPFAIQSDPIDPSLTFANFVFQGKNQLTVDFFRKLQFGAFNPLFLYGDKGIGKSHLLHALGNQLISQGFSVFYVHAETFTQHVVGAIRSSQMRSFRRIYRNQDVLIVDDIHYFARRSATQEEFFHTFNALHTAGKQLILCSHFLPSQMEEIEPRLISRFEWGIVMSLSALPSQKMGEVLMNKAHLHNFPCSTQLCNFLIENFPSSSKSMIRALEALMIRHRSDQAISIDKAKALLTDLLTEEKKSRLTPEKILMSTAAYFGVRPNDILGKSQSRECTTPRKLAMFLCRENLSLSYQAIGRYFGKDHSTVMTAVRQIKEKDATCEIKSALNEIEQILKS